MAFVAPLPILHSAQSKSSHLTSSNFRLTSKRSTRCTPPSSRNVPSPAPSMVSKVDDKVEVTEYFNNVGFDRWNRIYSEEGEVNIVQLDIRQGHAETVRKVLKWIDDDGNASGLSVCDAGCGVGSLTLPLLQRGAIVNASDISQAMVDEAARRGNAVIPEKMGNVTFSMQDLESISGNYDTVCCIDVLIHYPTDKAAEMIRGLAEKANRRLIISFAPKTFFLTILKKIGEFFPGPSKSTRAYTHSEEELVKALEACGMKIKRTDFTGTRFYFSRLLEAVKE